LKEKKSCKEVERSTKDFRDYLAGRDVHAVSSSDMTTFGPILNASTTLSSPGRKGFWFTAPTNTFTTYDAPELEACEDLKACAMHRDR